MFDESGSVGVELVNLSRVPMRLLNNFKARLTISLSHRTTACLFAANSPLDARATAAYTAA